MKKCKRYSLWIFYIGGCCLIGYPFIALTIYKIFKFSIGDLYTFGLPLNDFISSWITLWGVVAAFIGLYQIKLSQDKLSHNISYYEKSLEAQQKQLDQQQQQFIENKFQTNLCSLASDDYLIRLIAVENLYYLAMEHKDKYRDRVCQTFCEFIKTFKTDKKFRNETKMPPDMVRILNLLFVITPNIFNECEKDLSHCRLVDVTLCNATISNTKLIMAELFKCTFHCTDFTNCMMFNLVMRDSEIKTSKIKKCQMHKSEFVKVKFNQTKLRDISFCDSDLLYCTFARCSMLNIDFSSSKIDDTKFIKTKFNEKSELISCDVSNTSFSFSNESDLKKFQYNISSIHQSKINVEGNIIKIL